jgi:putative oxidoreductase
MSTQVINNVIKNIVDTNAGFSTLALRIPTAIIFMAHGSQKLFGWFGGYGLAGTGQCLSPGYLMALLSGSAEFFGGLALLIGLLVRPAAAVLAFTMVIAIFSTHIGNGLFMANNGYEFALALLAVTISLVVSGAGEVSVDRRLAGLVAAR